MEGFLENDPVYVSLWVPQHVRCHGASTVQGFLAGNLVSEPKHVSGCVVKGELMDLKLVVAQHIRGAWSYINTPSLRHQVFFMDAMTVLLIWMYFSVIDIYFVNCIVKSWLLILALTTQFAPIKSHIPLYFKGWLKIEEANLVTLCTNISWSWMSASLFMLSN